MKRILKIIFFAIAKVVVILLIGLRIQHRERLPIKGPAILVANHNSHLDTIVLISLFPLAIVHQLRPLASKQYFLERHSWLAWFSQYILDIIPVSIKSEKGADAADSRPEGAAHRSFLADCDAALAQNQILILYPEGSRGEPECLSEFRCGISHLAKRYPQVRWRSLSAGESFLFFSMAWANLYQRGNFCWCHFSVGSMLGAQFTGMVKNKPFSID
jgi:1-acyl-sn-glycerol-3-phosphate acyltransferase